MLKKLLPACALFLCAASAIAQSTPPANSPTRPMARGGQSCLQQAGLNQSVVEQLRSIQRDMHSQVEAVCSNTSLTAQQRNQQAHEIRQQAHQKIESLMTPEQQKTLMACREEHMGGHMGAGGFGEARGGCGEWQQNGARPTNGSSGSVNGSGSPSTN